MFDPKATSERPNHLDNVSNYPLVGVMATQTSSILKRFKMSYNAPKEKISVLNAIARKRKLGFLE
ncbi:hypothetical protein L914_12898 [Phytophthora nicotianae]|uniref:Uncharacterized protein n=2 Tax=Phytophthora nicotianae TaxID=4792 RepID=V9EQ28_PHYNI|nr:hypothetical protein F443_13411 [Phytophthora nicotianae P1569]ETM41316.1 hypothetical protein L914_12898 [Phytophthora nicotianae]